MQGRLSTPTRMALELGSEQYMLRFVQQQLPPMYEATIRDVLSDKTKIFVPEFTNPPLDAFLRGYTGNPAFRIPCHFSYISTGQFEGKGIELGDGIRRFLEHAKEDIGCPVFDLSAEILEKFRDCGFVPTTKSLFLAGAAISRLCMNEDMLGDGSTDWAQLRSYKAAVEARRESVMKRMLQLHIDVRESLFFVSDKERGAGPVMDVGRKSVISRDDKEFSSGDEVHALLNPIIPEPGRWYKIPAGPFAVYPGVVGWRIRHALSQNIDGELARVIARQDKYSIAPEMIEQSVKLKTFVSPDADGSFRYPIHGHRDEGLVLEHVTVSSDGYPAVNIEVSGSMAFIIPLQGELSVKSTVIRSSSINQYTYKVEPGGGAILLSPEKMDDETVKFSVRAHERSSFLVFQPELLRLLG